MLSLLALLTFLVVLLPMLPALIEWLRPSDVVPLPIDETDALDPSFLAHRFAGMLQEAALKGVPRLGQSELVRISHTAAAVQWPFLPAERDVGISRRVWDIDGDASLPQDVSFHAEVAAAGALRTAVSGVYRALWSGGAMHLSKATSVTRWAHGPEVTAQSGCALAGRITATDVLSLADDVSFTLLHAPSIHFLPRPEPTASLQAHGRQPMDGWPDDLAWDPMQRRGFSKGSVSLPANREIDGDLVFIGNLVLGANCRVTGSLKSHGALRLGRGCQVSGSVFADGGIHFAEECVIGASVVSETDIALGPDCRIGSVTKWATVAAPRIAVAKGVSVHGTIWAGEKGWTDSLRESEPAELSAPALEPKSLPPPKIIHEEERALA